MPRAASQSVKLRPADPFDLIRWLARSQSDPRKAVGELVQNSIDARARTVRIERRRLRGGPALFIRDDGEGVLPEMTREEALRYIATNIGHSRKRGLSPSERHRLVIAGKYGVGLLGFWAIGRRMEIRSRVGGSGLFALQLVEDQEQARIVEQPLPIDAPQTYTEVAVLEAHEAAERAISGRRLADYLGAELRGPLLEAGVEVLVHDAMARGTAQKSFKVAPRPFSGERLEVPAELEVEGAGPARVELYLARGLERPAIQVGCAGTLVADDIAELHALELDQPPWTGRDLVGLIDFPDFTVPPGTRRGVAPDRAALAFAQAMERLKPLVEAELERLERERRAAADRQVVQELRRALRGLQSRLPQYELPRVRDSEERGAAPSGAPLSEEPELPGVEAGPEAQPELFPPGPLASVGIAPDLVEIVPGREHRVRAVPRDADGRRIGEGVLFSWSLEGAGFTVRGEGPRPAVAVEVGLPAGAEARLRVRAVQGERAAEAQARLVAVAPSEEESTSGVPEPELVDDPLGAWRSRFDGTIWQVNAAHEDYLALRAEPRGRVRYLLMLLAKEIVGRAHGAPGSERLLEALVEVLAHAERNLRGA